MSLENLINVIFLNIKDMKWNVANSMQYNNTNIYELITTYYKDIEQQINSLDGKFIASGQIVNIVKICLENIKIMLNDQVIDALDIPIFLKTINTIYLLSSEQITQYDIVGITSCIIKIIFIITLDKKIYPSAFILLDSAVELLLCNITNKKIKCCVF